MNRRNVVRLALAAALLGAAIPGAALAQVSTKWWTPNQQAQRFDRFHRSQFEGHWVAQDVNADFRGGRSAVMLPNILHIDQERRAVLVADRRHNLLQVITTDGRFHTMDDGAFRGDEDATMLYGDLKGNGKRLVANGRDARGRLVRQVMILRDHGNILVVRTQVERGRSGRMVEVEKVYERV